MRKKIYTKKPIKYTFEKACILISRIKEHFIEYFEISILNLNIIYLIIKILKYIYKN